jgi:hypothetical protein
MTRRWMMVVSVLAVLVAMAVPAAAHNEYRIIGTIEKVTATQLSVRQTKDNKIIAMKIDKTAVVMRGKKKVGQSALQPALSVVVIACGDSIDKLEVLEVKILPSPGTK